MTPHLLYGRSQIPVTIPSDANVTVIRKPSMPTLTDPIAAVHAALGSPVAALGSHVSPSLMELARGSTIACIAICDITRPVPNGLFLRPMIETLVKGGISISNITVLVATGLHRPNLDDELLQLVGDPWVIENVRVVNHDARNDADHVELGVTPTRGTVVKLDRRFVEADIRIATGLVEPHFMAGYSGGRKVIAPGLAHAETITTFHNCRFMADAKASNCNLAGNPLHEEQLEIVKLLGGALALNTVIDEDRNLAMVNFGEILHSHAQAVEFVQQYCRVGIDQRFETVVTSAAGYPLDKTYYQTIKGMVGAIGALQPGGNLIIVSECEEGLGSDEFVLAQQRLIREGVAGFMDLIRDKSHAAIDEWQTQMQIKAMEAGSIYLYSSLPPDQIQLTGVTPVDDLEETIANCVATSAEKTLAIIPEGPYVIPFYDPERVRGLG
ncbi:nickel-dependent lactate racemase [Stieleria sp. TO1_6]|uniref:nickel-dependent lactate racemase n=1 Tax=Stieleria tagensis TaxID=2956795 RepID=UPI00209B90A1|nr:nickel-dependent lactate racemase [Stieleria tagensis]MCO8120666.1 nickel-dependent lactate racemase [Stieleria tagensis]